MSVRFELPGNVELPENLKPAGTSGKRLLEIERARAVRGSRSGIVKGLSLTLVLCCSQSFSSNDLAVYLYGQEYLDRMARILAIVEREEAFSKHAIFYQGRSEKFRHGLRKVGQRLQSCKDVEYPLTPPSGTRRSALLHSPTSMVGPVKTKKWPNSSLICLLPLASTSQCGLLRFATKALRSSIKCSSSPR